MDFENDFYYEEDYDDYDDTPRCEECGAILKKYYEHGEFWGAPYTQVIWECPNCD